MKKNENAGGTGFTMPPQMVMSLLKTALKGKKKAQFYICFALYSLIVGVVINVKWIIELFIYLF